MVEVVGIAFGVLNLILLIKIWQMTNSVEKIKKNVEIITVRGASPELKKKVIIEKAISYLDLWHKIKKSSNIEKLSTKIEMAFYKDSFFNKLIQNYNVSDIYTVEDLKKDCLDKLSK
jgi:hypothetical protein